MENPARTVYGTFLAAKNILQSGFGCHNVFSNRKQLKPFCGTFFAAKNVSQTGFAGFSIGKHGFQPRKPHTTRSLTTKTSLRDVFGLAAKKCPADWFWLSNCLWNVSFLRLENVLSIRKTCKTSLRDIFGSQINCTAEWIWLSNCLLCVVFAVGKRVF